MEARRAGAVGLAAAEAALRHDRRALACAVVARCWERRTKAGDWMAILTLEDAVVRREAVCFARVWDRVADEMEALVQSGEAGLLSVGWSGDKLVVEEARPLRATPARTPGPPLCDFTVLDLETTTGPEPPPEDPAWTIVGATIGRRGVRADERQRFIARQRIVEVGLASFRRAAAGRWTLAQRVGRLCDPGTPISEGAAAVHGICDADVAGQPRFSERAPRLAAVLGERVLVTYNGHGFDLPVLRAEMARAGVEWTPAVSVDAYDWVRTRYRGRRDRPQSRQLVDQCAYHGVRLDGAHRAPEDAAATGLLLARLVGDGWAPDDLDALALK
jgi:DNA polymerase III epsilon subunit-like protein